MRPSIAVLALLVLAAPSLGVQGKPASEVTPNDLYQALRPSAIRASLPQADRWWPSMPEFNVGIGPDSRSVRFYLAQNYERPGDAAKPRVQTVVTLYADAAAATAGQESMRKEELKTCALITGPTLGEASYWMLRPAAGPESPAAVTVRFRLGPCTGRVTWLSAIGLAKPSQVAACAQVVVSRLREILAGRLEAEPLSPEISEYAVSARDLRDLGKLLGEAEVPAESWALVDTLGAPAKQRDFLRKNGASTLGFWRYGAIRKPGQVVEITLFPFRDAAAARTWVQTTIGEAAAKKLVRPALGRTGPVAVFTHRADAAGAFEVQFAKGRCAVSVYGYAPFGETSPAMEGVVRAMSERWYALMPAQ